MHICEVTNTVQPGPAGMHVPLEHACPNGHAWPQLPQFVASVIVLTHALPHSMSPALHAHAPPMHATPVGQA
jgi:hypothetical protein